MKTLGLTRLRRKEARIGSCRYTGHEGSRWRQDRCDGQCLRFARHEACSQLQRSTWCATGICPSSRCRVSARQHSDQCSCAKFCRQPNLLSARSASQSSNSRTIEARRTTGPLGQGRIRRSLCGLSVQRCRQLFCWASVPHVWRVGCEMNVIMLCSTLYR